MELEDLNYLIGKANRSNVTSLCLSLKGPNFLPPEISDLKNITILNSRNYLSKWVK